MFLSEYCRIVEKKLFTNNCHGKQLIGKINLRSLQNNEEIQKLEKMKIEIHNRTEPYQHNFPKMLIG